MIFLGGFEKVLRGVGGNLSLRRIRCQDLGPEKHFLIEYIPMVELIGRFPHQSE